MSASLTLPPFDTASSILKAALSAWERRSRGLSELNMNTSLSRSPLLSRYSAMDLSSISLSTLTSSSMGSDAAGCSSFAFLYA